jgi:hypothetical protein
MDFIGKCAGLTMAWRKRRRMKSGYKRSIFRLYPDFIRLRTPTSDGDRNECCGVRAVSIYKEIMPDLVKVRDLRGRE